MKRLSYGSACNNVALGLCVIACALSLSATSALSADTKAVVIFVHGFTGSADKTWGNFPEFIKTDPKLKAVDVFVWEYPTSLFGTSTFPFSLFRNNPCVDLLGSALLSEVRRRFVGYDSVYLVGHSLGGIVIQSMVVEALKKGRRQDIEHIKHIFLFGSPNRGAQIPPLLNWNPQLRQIDITSDVVQSLLDEWVNRVYRPDIKPGDENAKFRIPVTAIAGLEDVLVTPASARSFFQDPPAEVVPGTHTSMKEPASRDSTAYTIVQTTIAESESSNSPVRSTAADLHITPLTADRVFPLQGHKVKVVNGKPVHTAGARVSFTLSHNKRAQESIVLKGMELVIHRFERAIRTELAYNVSGDELRGAGTMAPHKFVVTLRDGKMVSAKWLITDPTEKVVTARTENLFDYEGVKYLVFKANADDVEEVEGTIIARGAGLYEISFVFRYSVGGQDRAQESERLLIYRKD